MKTERLRVFMSRANRPQGAHCVKDPSLAKDGHLELRPARTDWGVEMDQALLGTEEYIHWERKAPVRSDGSTARA